MVHHSVLLYVVNPETGGIDRWSPPAVIPVTYPDPPAEFLTDAPDLDRAYDAMYAAYQRVYERCGVPATYGCWQSTRWRRSCFAMVGSMWAGAIRTRSPTPRGRWGTKVACSSE